MRVVTILLLLPFAAAPACAALIPALEVQTIQFTGTQNSNLSSDGVTGWTFTATESFNISALGYYDHGQDGFVDPHDIGIWHIDGAVSTLLATTTITSETSSTLIGDFRYSSIAPLQITAGEDYVVGGTIGFGVGVTQYDPTVTPTPSGWTSAPQITNVAGRFGSIFPVGSGFNNSNYPSDFGTGSEPPFLGPNILIASVPEPNSLILACCGIGCMALSRRRKRNETAVSR